MANNIDIFQGDNKTYELTVKDRVDAVVDITGFTIKFTVVKYKGDTTYLIEKTTAQASEILITDGPNGLAQIYLIPADTTNMAGIYWYDVQTTDLSGKIRTVIRNTFTVKVDITP